MAETEWPLFHGNRTIVAQLQAQIAAGRLPHAFIFSGPEGVGKRTFALQLAQALNCSPFAGAPAGGACGQCAACRKVIAGSHPDVHGIGLEDDSRQIKIEQIRQLRSRLELTPLEGRARVFVIDPAERLTPSAANALLKSLEEPPAGTHFFLITSNAQELLVTIRSRCQLHHFVPMTTDEIRRAGVKDELMVRWAQGSIGRALSMDKAQLQSSRNELLEFLEEAVGARGEQWASLIAASSELSRSKEDYGEKLWILSVLVSDMLYIKEGLDRRVINIDVSERLGALAEKLSLEKIAEIGTCLRFVETGVKRYLNRQMLSDMIALTLNAETPQIGNDKLLDYR